MEGNKPLKKFKAGAISAAVWENQGKDKQGNPTIYMSVSIERNYKDAEGNFKSTSSMRYNDLPKVNLVAWKAFEFLTETRDKNKPKVTEEAVH